MRSVEKLCGDRQSFTKTLILKPEEMQTKIREHGDVALTYSSAE